MLSQTTTTAIVSISSTVTSFIAVGTIVVLILEIILSVYRKFYPKYDANGNEELPMCSHWYDYLGTAFVVLLLVVAAVSTAYVSNNAQEIVDPHYLEEAEEVKALPAYEDTYHVNAVVKSITSYTSGKIVAEIATDEYGTYYVPIQFGQLKEYQQVEICSVQGDESTDLYLYYDGTMHYASLER
jgi:hypothetical protein